MDARLSAEQARLKEEYLQIVRDEKVRMATTSIPDSGPAVEVGARRVNPDGPQGPLQPGQTYFGGPIHSGPAALPVQPPPEPAKLYGTTVQDAQGNKYITVSDPANPGKPECYKQGADGKVSRVEVTSSGFSRTSGKGVLIFADGTSVQATQQNGEVSAAEIAKLRAQAVAVAPPAPPVPAAPPSPATPVAAAVTLTAQQRDGYLRVAGFDGPDREAALMAFATKNNLLGADKKPDMDKVNQALQAKVQGTPEAQAFIDRVLKDPKATKEEKQAAQWTMVANGAKMPISTQPDGTMDGKIGRETRTQGAVVLADLAAGRVQRYAVPVVAAPVAAAAPIPARVPAASETLARVEPAPQIIIPAVPAAPTATVARADGPPQPPSRGTNPIRLGSPEAYALAGMAERQGARYTPYVQPGTPQFNPVGYASANRTPGYFPTNAPTVGTPQFPEADRAVGNVTRQLEREVVAGMRGASQRGGAWGVLAGAGAILAEGTFDAGRQEAQAARQRNAIIAAGGNAPSYMGGMGGEFGRAAADPDFLARKAEADAKVAAHMRDRAVTQASEHVGGAILNGIYTPRGTGGVTGDLTSAGVNALVGFLRKL